MPLRPHLAAAFAVLLCLPLAAAAQTAEIAFGGLTADPTLPVEVTSDSLTLNQTDGSAVFSGNVIVAQGEMKLSAAEVRVEYGAGGDQRRIERLHATGGVLLVNGDAAAEAAAAEYDIAASTIELSGDVLLTQGGNTMSGQKLTVNLAEGTGRMDGRVRTILQPGGN